MPGGYAVTVTPASGDGVTTAFTLAYAISNEDVYVNGLRQHSPSQYSISGTTLTFITAPPNTSTIDVFGVAVVQSVAATFSKTSFSTAGTIINRAAAQLGLTTAAPSSLASPYASTDQNFVQLCEMLNMVGEDLQNKCEWGHFVREGTIVTASSATSYTLPSDYYKMVDQSEWNRSTRFPMIGPLSGQEVQYLKARLAGVLIQVAYRIQGNVITFAIAPSNAQTLAFEYISANWVWSTGGSQPDATGAVATGDTVLFDADLSIAGLKLAFLEAKGFDTLVAQKRFDDILDHAISKNLGAKVLTMGGIGVNADHLIDATNLPATGYG